MNIECDIALRYLTQNRRKGIPNTCRSKIKVVLGDSRHTQPNITAFAVKGSACKVLFQCHQALISSHNNRKMIYTILHKSFSIYIIYIFMIQNNKNVLIFFIFHSISFLFKNHISTATSYLSLTAFELLTINHSTLKFYPINQLLHSLLVAPHKGSEHITKHMHWKTRDVLLVLVQPNIQQYRLHPMNHRLRLAS